MTNFPDEMAAAFRPDHDPEYREILVREFGEMGADEALRQVEQAERVLDGLLAAATEVCFPLHYAMLEATPILHQARKVAESYATRCSCQR